MQEEIRYQYIDALRGWAVLMIILMHSWAGGPNYPLPNIAARIISSGYVGIHMLFVATGLSLCLRYTSTSFNNINGWYCYAIRRGCRIVPLWYFAIVFYLILLGRTSRNIDGLDIALTASFLHNWRWSSINTVVPGGWSIGAVVSFYVLFPLLLRWAGSRRIFWVLVIGGVAGTQFLNVYTQAHHWNQGFAWSFPGAGVIFLFGMAAARYLSDRRNGSGAKAGNTISVCLLVFLIAGLPFWHFPEWFLTYRLQVGAVAGLLCLSLHKFPARLVVNPFMAWVGRMSFSILVVHVFVLVYTEPLLASLADRIGWQHPGESFLSIYLLSAVCGTLPLAFLSYTFIEKPAIRLGRRLTQDVLAAGPTRPSPGLRAS